MKQITVKQITERLHRQCNAQFNTELNFEEMNTLRMAAQGLKLWHKQMAAPQKQRNMPEGYTVQLVVDADGRSFRRVRGGGRDDMIKTPNLGRGHLNRVRAICKLHALHYYVNTEPGKTSLYISREPMDASNYHILGMPLNTHRYQ